MFVGRLTKVDRLNKPLSYSFRVRHVVRFISNMVDRQLLPFR